MLPAIPEIKLFKPPVCFVGQPTTIEVEVTAKHDMKVDFIAIKVWADQGWQTGIGRSRKVEYLTYPELEQHVMGAGTLPAGVSRFSFTFVLPLDMPPTHRVSPTWSNCWARVHVSIPWWPDGSRKCHLDVRWPQVGPVPRTPSSVRNGAQPGRPRLEMSLASTRLIVGEQLVGSLALIHVDDHKSHEVRIIVRPTVELLEPGSASDRSGAGAFVHRITLPEGTAGAGVPFSIQLPTTMTPSFRAATHNLSWSLTAELGAYFGTHLLASARLEIIDAIAAETTPRLAEAPLLGDQRVASVLGRFAEANGWHIDAEGRATPFVLERAFDHSGLRIEYAYRGEQGTFLVATLSYRSLGLGLTVAASSTLRHVFLKDIEVDIAAWDRAHHVVSRCEAQTLPLLKTVVPAVIASRRVGTLVHWSDHEMVFERSIVGVEEFELVEIQRDLEPLARAVEEARQLIGPPSEIVVDLASWRELARWLDDELVVGDLSIHGTLDERTIEVALVWDDDRRITHVHVSAGDPALATAAAREVTLELAEPWNTVPATGEQLTNQLTAWPHDFVDLRVRDGVASASWAVPAGDAPVLDATRVRELVLALRSLLLALEPAVGPYR